MSIGTLLGYSSRNELKCKDLRIVQVITHRYRNEMLKVIREMGKQLQT